MARIEVSPQIQRDLTRFLEHMVRFQVLDAVSRVDQIVQAIQILTHSPLIGRPVEDGRRELVIGLRPRAYVALYRFDADTDTVLILAIRSQNEAGYRSS